MHGSHMKTLPTYYYIPCIIIKIYTIVMSAIHIGKYRDGDERSIDPAPWSVCDTFAVAVELIVASLKDR